MKNLLSLVIVMGIFSGTAMAQTTTQIKLNCEAFESVLTGQPWPGRGGTQIIAEDISQNSQYTSVRSKLSPNVKFWAMYDSEGNDVGLHISESGKGTDSATRIKYILGEKAFVSFISGGDHYSLSCEIK